MADIRSKKAHPALFYILKAVVDSKTPKLRADVRGADAAKSQIPNVQKNIADVQYALDSARRYDPSDVAEYRECLELHEARMTSLQKSVAVGNSANAQLAYAEKFNKLFTSVIDEAARIARNRELVRKIANLQSMYDALDARDTILDNRISACRINMDSYNDCDPVHQDSAAELEKLYDESENLRCHMDAIQEQIRKLRQMCH